MAPVDLHIGTNGFSGCVSCWLYCKSALNIKLPIAEPFLNLHMDMNCVRLCTGLQTISPPSYVANWSLQRNERFAQGGPRGMGPGNPGYGRVREEFDGPAKKPRF